MYLRDDKFIRIVNNEFPCRLPFTARESNSISVDEMKYFFIAMSLSGATDSG